MKDNFIVGISGASGAPYAAKLIEELLRSGFEINLMITRAAKEIIKAELALDLTDDEGEMVRKYFGKDIKYHDIDNLSSPLASGSFRTKGMIVIPCSMSTLASLANGLSSNLMERAADVMLKEKRRLILVLRETPLNLIHLENMRALALSGADIVPAMPAFYHKPKGISDMVDFMVGKVLDLLGLEHELYKRWGQK